MKIIIHKLLEDIKAKELDYGLNGVKVQISLGRNEAQVLLDALENITLDKIRAEITDWQTDIHDNENDAESHDFVFERIYEIFDEYKAESKE